MSFDMPHDIHTQEGADRFTQAAGKRELPQTLTGPYLRAHGTVAVIEGRSAAATGLNKREEIDTKKEIPFNYNASIPFTSVTQKCQHGAAQISAGVSLNLDAKVKGNLKLGVSAVGDAAKSKLTSFAEHFIGTQR